MSGQTSPSLLFAAVLGAAVVGGAGFAFFRPDAPSSTESAASHVAQEGPSAAADPLGAGMNDPGALPPGHPGVGDPNALPPGHPGMGSSGALPPGHPGMGDPSAAAPSEEGAEPGLSWKVPAAWKTVPNPSSMRLATYRVPRAAGDTDDADVSVTRAGGGTDANIDRWVGQFEGKPEAKRETKTVHGFKVTEVEVSGTYLGGGMMGGGASSKPGFTLLGAIVEGPGTPYFFKLTGPSASVHGARAAFDAMLAGMTSSN